MHTDKLSAEGSSKAVWSKKKTEAHWKNPSVRTFCPERQQGQMLVQMCGATHCSSNTNTVLHNMNNKHLAAMSEASWQLKITLLPNGNVHS